MNIVVTPEKRDLFAVLIPRLYAFLAKAIDVWTKYVKERCKYFKAFLATFGPFCSLFLAKYSEINRIELSSLFPVPIWVPCHSTVQVGVMIQCMGWSPTSGWNTLFGDRTDIRILSQRAAQPVMALGLSSSSSFHNYHNLNLWMVYQRGAQSSKNPFQNPAKFVEMGNTKIKGL